VLYEHTLTLSKGNLSDKTAYLYDLMECPRDISSVSETEKLRFEWSTQSEQDQKLKPLEKTLQSKPIWEKLLMIKTFFERIGYRNNIPYHFEKSIAPFFFRSFPNAAIWFVERNQEELRLIFNREFNLARNIFGVEQALWGKYPQSMSGLNIYDTLQDFGLGLSLIVNFPKINGSNALTNWGSFLFIPEYPIDISEEYQLNITDALVGNLNLLYADDRTITTGTRHRWKYFESELIPKYLEWYVDHLGTLADFVRSQKDLEAFYLASLTLSRICVETYGIQSSRSCFFRKIAFFNLLDKYACLIKEFSKTTISEVDIWKTIVKQSYYKKKLKRFLRKIDAHVGSHFEGIAKECYEDNTLTLSLEKEANLPEDEIADLLRAYRDSHHGYLLWKSKRKLLLTHSGNISNALPDLSIILWHAFLQNPEDFVRSIL
jgi:hypothetical protein